MCTRKPKEVQLPEKYKLCTLPNTGCRFVEIWMGKKKKWEKKAAVLAKAEGDSDLKLYIFMKEESGLKYSMEKLREVGIQKQKIDGDDVLKLQFENQPKLKLKINAKYGSLWLCALYGCASMISDSIQLEHKSHDPIRDGDPAKDLQEEPDNNVYIGSREGYVAPAEGSGSIPKEKKEKGKNNNNATPLDRGGVVEKSDEKKKTESRRKLKAVASKTKTKQSTTESGKNQKEAAAVKNKSEDHLPPKADENPAVQRTDSEPDVKKTQETMEHSAKGLGATPDNKIVTPLASTPGPCVTPIPPVNEEKIKTVTLSDENEPPEKKK